MNEVWTLARWTAKPGREEEFAKAWRELADWTRGEFPAARGILLRDRETPAVFYSFGPWESAEAAERWRSSAGFRQRVGRIRELLDDFEPHALDPTERAGL